MEIREFAIRVISSEELDDKLTTPTEPLTDDDPGEPLLLEGPSRPPALCIQPGSKTRVPSIEGFHDPQQRRRILHSYANHELQATELFAWALLAFPTAPAEFRRGILQILYEEQRHTRLYIGRLRSHGGEFGDFPVSGYFWSKARTISTPIQFVCAMSLTFEGANLDHAVDSAAIMRKAGDEKSALAVEQIHDDEVGHVYFGWKWLEQLKEPEQTMWDAYCANVTWPLRPALAKGKTFHRDSRLAAGLDEEFIRLLEESGQ